MHVVLVKLYGIFEVEFDKLPDLICLLGKEILFSQPSDDLPVFFKKSLHVGFESGIENSLILKFLFIITWFAYTTTHFNVILPIEFIWVLS